MAEKISNFSVNDFEIKQRDLLYQGIFRMVRYHLRHKKFNGEWSETFTREVMERKSAAAILPYDPLLDQVILIEQFRPGCLTHKEGPWILEIVAGTYTTETPAETAKREADEEAGCKILDIQAICEYFVSPGGSNEYLHLYCGRIDASDVGGIHGLADEQEDIRAISMPLDEAYKMVQEGKIKTSPAIISLLWLQLNKEWLKQLWL